MSRFNGDDDEMVNLFPNEEQAEDLIRGISPWIQTRPGSQPWSTPCAHSAPIRSVTKSPITTSS